MLTTELRNVHFMSPIYSIEVTSALKFQTPGIEMSVSILIYTNRGICCLHVPSIGSRHLYDHAVHRRSWES